MKASGFLQYKVTLARDPDTGQIVAVVPTLGIADYGLDSKQALDRLNQMACFHIESLISEKKPIPTERRRGQGLYIRVRVPASAA